jgi:polyhydroxyalkanoate synthesis regulator phasin
MDGNANPGQYQIRLRKGDWELEISAPEQDFVLREWERLVNFSLQDISLNNTSEKSRIPDHTGTNGDFGNGRSIKPQTLNEFIRQFKFQSNLEKTLVLGYWCELKLQQQGFTVEDILAKYKEAKEQAPKNIRRDLSSLVSKSFLLQDNQSSEVYELTNTGIREVEQKLLGQSQ